MLAKQLLYFAGADSAGVVLGARVPVVLTAAGQRAHAHRLGRGRQAAGAREAAALPKVGNERGRGRDRRPERRFLEHQVLHLPPRGGALERELRARCPGAHGTPADCAPRRRGRGRAWPRRRSPLSHAAALDGPARRAAGRAARRNAGRRGAPGRCTVASSSWHQRASTTGSWPAGALRAARAAAPAAQPRGHPRAVRTPARRAAGRLLRHGVPPHHPGGGAAVRFAAALRCGRRAALRFPRAVVRVRRLCVAVARCAGRERPHSGVFISATARACVRCPAGAAFATTMGVHGGRRLPMGTRSGSLDPACCCS